MDDKLAKLIFPGRLRCGLVDDCVGIRCRTRYCHTDKSCRCLFKCVGLEPDRTILQCTRQFYDRTVGCAVSACLNLPERYATTRCDQCHCFCPDRLGKLVLHPCNAIFSCNNRRSGFDVVVHQRAGIDFAAAGCDPGLELLHQCFIRRCPESDHDTIAIVHIGGSAATITGTAAQPAQAPECSRIRRWLRKLPVKLHGSLNIGFAPDQFLHRLLRLDPGPTCQAPA